MYIDITRLASIHAIASVGAAAFAFPVLILECKVKVIPHQAPVFGGKAYLRGLAGVLLDAVLAFTVSLTRYCQSAFAIFSSFFSSRAKAL